MGWASANPIFDRVADELIARDADPKLIYHVCSTLIRELQSGGWDTEDESLREYLHRPEIVLAFSDHGVFQQISGKDAAPQHPEPGTIYEQVNSDDWRSTYYRYHAGTWEEISEKEVRGR